VAMRPVLRGEEPAACDPVGGLGEVTGTRWRRWMPDTRLYCATKCWRC